MTDVLRDEARGCAAHLIIRVCCPQLAQVGGLFGGAARTRLLDVGGK